MARKKLMPVVTVFFADLDPSDPRIEELKRRFKADVVEVFKSARVDLACEVFPFSTPPPHSQQK